MTTDEKIQKVKESIKAMKEIEKLEKNYEKAIEMLEIITRDYPDFTQMDRVYYLLGQYYTQSAAYPGHFQGGGLCSGIKCRSAHGRNSQKNHAL